MNIAFRSKSDCTHRHLHLELILVELEEDVGECALKEGGGPQNQNQLEVPREGALKEKEREDDGDCHLCNKQTGSSSTPSRKYEHLIKAQHHLFFQQPACTYIIPYLCLSLCLPCENAH